MSNARRTKTGCWTCRLRRKKCDEVGLPCSNCSTRGVFCHGYGEKPAWKDRGTQEKEEIGRLQLRSRVRRKSRSNTFSSSTDEADLQQIRGSGPTLDMTVPVQLSPPYSSTPVSAMTITPTSEQAEFDLLGSLSLRPDDLWALDDDPMWADPLSVGIAHEIPLDIDTPRGQVTIGQHGQGREAVAAWCCPHLSGSDAGKRGPELIMQFLSETFPLQHRLQHGSSLTDRSWVLNLLMKSPTFYSASLSMSALHCFNTLSPGSEVREIAFQDYHEYRTMALRGLKGLMDSASWTSVTTHELAWSEHVVCGVQIALLEALGKNMQDCQSHLKSAARCLTYQPEVLQSKQSLLSTTPVTYAQLTHSSKHRDVAVNSVRPSMEQQALEFFSVLLIWNDVQHCSAQRQLADAQEVYSNLLRDECFADTFREITTCEAWVFDSMLEATSLDAWKREQEAQGVLSIRELVNRGQKIESHVEQKLQSLPNSCSGDYVDASKCGAKFHTAVFAHALLIHLHCVVSGSWPGLPEIKSSVDKAFDLWQLLPSPIDLRTLAWPFLVTASLATETKRDWFRTVATEFQPEKSVTSNVFPWIVFLEECWKGFDDRDTERNVSRCDWRTVCHRLGLSLLFV